MENNKNKALLNSDNEVNNIIIAYAAKLGLISQTTAIDAQKSAALAFKTHEMVIAKFSVHDKPNMTQFFEDTFLLIDKSIDVIPRIFFLSLAI